MERGGNDLWPFEVSDDVLWTALLCILKKNYYSHFSLYNPFIINNL